MDFISGIIIFPMMIICFMCAVYLVSGVDIDIWFDFVLKRKYCVIENGVGLYNVGLTYTIFNIKLGTVIVETNSWGGYHAKIEDAEYQLNEILREKKNKEIRKIIK